MIEIIKQKALLECPYCCYQFVEKEIAKRRNPEINLNSIAESSKPITYYLEVPEYDYGDTYDWIADCD